MPNQNASEQLKARLNALREGGFFGKKYAKKIAEQCGVSEWTVYNTAGGNSINEEVAEALIKLAESKKLERLNERARAILED